VFGLAAAAILSRIGTAQPDVLVKASVGRTEVHLVVGFLGAASLLSLLPAIVVVRQRVANSKEFDLDIQTSIGVLEVHVEIEASNATSHSHAGHNH